MRDSSRQGKLGGRQRLTSYNHILLDDDDSGNDYVQTLGRREVHHWGRCSWEHCNDRATLPPSFTDLAVGDGDGEDEDDGNDKHDDEEEDSDDPHQVRLRPIEQRKPVLNHQHHQRGGLSHHHHRYQRSSIPHLLSEAPIIRREKRQR